MITLTPDAIAKVKSILTERKDVSGLRVEASGGGCSGFQYRMTLENESREDDKILDLDGLKVFVDANSLLYLNGTKIDFVNSAGGSGFKFDNPNENDACNCGESFEC